LAIQWRGWRHWAILLAKPLLRLLLLHWLGLKHALTRLTLLQKLRLRL
jgi:hypothetical protein